MTNHDIPRLEAKITELSSFLATLGDGTDLRELIRIIRNPGWTTPAESILVNGIVDAMLVNVKALSEIKKSLIEGAGKVGKQI